MSENKLLLHQNVLWCSFPISCKSFEFRHVLNNFFGDIVSDIGAFSQRCDAKCGPMIAVLTGDVGILENCVPRNEQCEVWIVEEFCFNSEKLLQKCGECGQVVKNVNLRQIPLNVYNVGVLFPLGVPAEVQSHGQNYGHSLLPNKNTGLFEQGYFLRIVSEHQFQNLTESNKDGVALRKGLYISAVHSENSNNASDDVRPGQTQCRLSPDQENGNAASESEHASRSADSEISSLPTEPPLWFHLLRCSSNFQGPTENFSSTDRRILERVNSVLPTLFSSPEPVNHVLAQIYYNERRPKSGTESTLSSASSMVDRKASIKRHSDKTKDMSASGVIGFATFYDFSSLVSADGLLEKTFSASAKDPFDVCYCGRTSVLTQLKFTLKNPALHPHLAANFRVTLYPDSLLLIPLSTNRLYQHEVKPSILPVDKIPTRMGYTMRCSKTRAVHRRGRTFILHEDFACGAGRKTSLNGSNLTEIPLAEATENDRRLIKGLYKRENATEDEIEYPPIFFSLNNGDYMRPIP